MADPEELTGLKKLVYEFHMSVCPSCKADHRQIETTTATLRALPKEEPSAESREKALAAFRKNKKQGV